MVLDEALVEERAGSAHNIAYIIETSDAFPFGRHPAIREVGAQVLERRKGINRGIESAQFPRVDLVHGSVTIYHQFAWVATVGYEYRHGRVSGLEGGVLCDRRESVFWTAIDVVDELVR